MKKVLVFIVFFLFVPVFINANTSKDYEVYDYMVEASIDVSGNLNVKEVILIKGQLNGFVRDLIYKSNNREFTGVYEDFLGSSIYNGKSIDVEKVGIVNYKGESLSYNVFDEDVKELEKSDSLSNCYQENSLSNGVSLNVFYESSDDFTYLYIEYLVGNVVVLHDDVAEIYYDFFNGMFSYDINNYKVRVLLPYESKHLPHVWSHGLNNINVSLMGKYKDKNYFIFDKKDSLLLVNDNEELVLGKDEDIVYYGAYLLANDIDKYTHGDIRMVFDKDLIMVDHPYLKKSNVSALDSILSVELKRSEDEEVKKKDLNSKIFVIYILTGFYFLGLLFFSVYFYVINYRKYIVNFDLKLFSDFTQKIDVTRLEYLFLKKVSLKSFSVCVLNLIYKNNISFKKLVDGDYEFTKVSLDNLSESEKVILDIMFEEVGDGSKTSLSMISNYLNESGSSFLLHYNSWRDKFMEEVTRENFYERTGRIKVVCVFYSVLCLILIFFHVYFDIFSVLSLFLLVFAFVFFMYGISFKNRTEAGIEYFVRCKAFKSFLLHFESLDTSNLILYLISSYVFNITDKLVTNSMKNDIILNYMEWTLLIDSIDKTMSSSVSLVRSSVRKKRINL